MFYIDPERERGADWIDAYEALTIAITTHEYSVRSASNFLIRRAGIDRIRTWCPYMKWLNRAASRVESGEREGCLIAPDFWVLFENAACRTLEDWKSGDFSTRRTNPRGATDIIQITAAKFSKADLLNELPAMAVDWMPARDALSYIVAGGISDQSAHLAICKRAHSGVLKSRARFYVEDTVDFHSGKKVKETHEFKLLDKQFWWAEGHEALTQNWISGDFSTWQDGEWKQEAFGVEFDRQGIQTMIPAGKSAGISQTAEIATVTGLPSAMPSDDIILAKIKEMKEMGIRRDAIAKLIRQINGFEQVGNEHTRRLATGVFDIGRPKKGAS